VKIEKLTTATILSIIKKARETYIKPKNNDKK
jgi:hypothetical protein